MALPACSLRDDEGLTRDDLAAMVLPKPTLGAAYAELELDEKQSGPIDNAQAAKANADLDDTRDDLIRAGRIDGYSQAFDVPARKAGLVELSTTVELLRDEQAATAYLEDRLGDFPRMRGRTRKGVRLMRGKRFPVAGIGDEAGGVEVTMAFRRGRTHSTIVAFRRGPVVAAADLTRVDRRDVRGEVQRLARVLDSRVAGVLRGEEIREPEPVVASNWVDLGALALSADDLPSGASVTREGPEARRGAERSYIREFDPGPNAFGESRAVLLLSEVALYPDSTVAAATHRALLGKAGRGVFVRDFVAGFESTAGAKPGDLRIRPLAVRAAGVSGIVAELRSSAGRFEMVVF